MFPWLVLLKVLARLDLGCPNGGNLGLVGGGFGFGAISDGVRAVSHIANWT